MKTVNIKGKDYVEVNERIKYFREKHKSGRIVSTLLDNSDGHCVFRTEIYLEDSLAATGHAREVEGDGMVNKTSYLENCETSAIGRALGCLGIGIDASVASAEEVGNAIAQQAAPRKTKAGISTLTVIPPPSSPAPPLSKAVQHEQNKKCFKEALKKRIKKCGLRVQLTDKKTATAILLDVCDDAEVLGQCLVAELDAPTNLMADDAAQWQIMTEVVTGMPAIDFTRLIVGVENE